MHTLYFILALITYYTLHSLLAANGVKAWLYRFVPKAHYRLVYNLLAMGLLAWLFYQFFSMEKTPLWSPNRVLPYPGGLLALSGLVWMVRALAGYNLAEFAGMEQLRNDQPPSHAALNLGGLNARVRHPLSFGILQVIWGVFFIWPTDAMFAFSIVSTVYLIIGSILEENKLVAQFGDAYRKYQQEVPMLVPFRWKT